MGEAKTKLLNTEKFDLEKSIPLSRPSLEEMGDHFGTDKITHHRYDLCYSRILEPFRSVQHGGMLEIGIDRGSSLNLWLNFFEKAFVYGVDINIAAEGPRFKIFQADQSDRSALRNVGSSINHPIFLIIDDGSHIPGHQATTFDFFFNEVLVPGGAYIIEDVEVSYWVRGGLYGYETRYGYRHPLSIVELFKSLADDVNSEFLSENSREMQSSELHHVFSLETRAAISSITFAKNCIIVHKKTDVEMSLNSRAYRFSNFI